MFEKHQNKHFWQFPTTLRRFLVEKGLKIAQNMPKITIFAYIAKISIFDVFWAILGPFYTRNALKVVGNCQKCLFWCFSNIFHTPATFHEAYPSNFQNRQKRILWGGVWCVEQNPYITILGLYIVSGDNIEQLWFWTHLLLP